MESEAKFYAVAQSVNDAMINSDSSGKITFWNPAAVIMFGYQEEEVLGKPFDDAHPGTIPGSPPEGNGTQPIRKESRVIGKTTELFGIKKEGTEFPLELSLAQWTAGNETFYTGFIGDITQRKGAEEALRQSEEKYRTILENIEDGYYEVDLAGNFTFFNDALTRIHEHSRDAMMGMNSREYTDEENSKLLYKDFNRVYQTGEPSKGVIYEVFTKNGGRKNLETSVSLIRDRSGKPIGFRGITRDITELTQAQKALSESEDRYRDLVENSQDLMYTHNLEGNLLSVNKTPVRLLGYSRESLLRMNLSDLLITELRDQLGAYLNEIQSQGRASGIMRLQTAGGRTCYWEYNNTLRTEGVTAPIVRGMAHDVTERIGAEKEVRETLKKLRSAMGGIIQAMTLTVESRDPYTAGHQKRVSNFARYIAQEMGMSKDQVEAVRMAGLVHDLGKISVPAEILSKPSRLSDIENNLIKVHPQTSYDILKDIDFPWPIAQIVLQHHERMDGSGYPAGLKGDEILIEAKVLMVADVVEAIASTVLIVLPWG